MPSLVTTKFRIHNAKQFREMFDEAALYGGATASAADIIFKFCSPGNKFNKFKAAGSGIGLKPDPNSAKALDLRAAANSSFVSSPSTM